MCVFVSSASHVAFLFIQQRPLASAGCVCGSAGASSCREWSSLQYVRVSVCACVQKAGLCAPPATRTTAHFLSSKTLNESSRKSFARSSEWFAVSDVTPLSRLCGSRIAVPRAFFFYCSAGLPSAAFEFMCMR